MDIPTADVKACRACGTQVIEATTNKMSRGQAVSILLLPDEDAHNHGLPSEQYAVSRVGGKFFAGQPSRNQRQAMLSAGQRFHLLHTSAECKKLAKAREGRQ